MRIIAVEGLDKAGKHTATNVLEHYFKSQGLKVARVSMPNYDSPTGALIRDWLTGKFDADTKTFELLQAADKQHMQKIIQDFEDDGVEILLMDRYLHSMLAYGAYDNDLDWLQELTKYMRTPDDVVYLDVEPEVSMHRRGKFGDNDIYESNIDRLRATGRRYHELFEENGQLEYPSVIHIVDANKPEMIVKSNMFTVASHIYEVYMKQQEELSTVRRA